MLRLKKEIYDKFGSQRKLSAATGIHETSISNIICGILEPSEENKELLEKALDLSWEELMKEI
jgi:transcriptional regulator with XRE-family HTH domain